MEFSELVEFVEFVESFLPEMVLFTGCTAIGTFIGVVMAKIVIKILDL